MKREKRNMHMKKPCGYQMKLLKGAEWRKLSRTHRINGYINRNAVIEKTENGKRGRRFHVCFGIYRIVADKSRKHIYILEKAKRKKKKINKVCWTVRVEQIKPFFFSVALRLSKCMYSSSYICICMCAMWASILVYYYFFSDSFAKFCSPHAIRGFGRTM